MPESLFVPCQIERGAFSSERVFEITLADGSTAGLANVRYLRNESQQPLDADSPAPGEKIRGFVQCHVIQRAADGTATIEVPSTDMLHVPADELVSIG
jgi:hypothetical protein